MTGMTRADPLPLVDSLRVTPVSSQTMTMEKASFWIRTENGHSGNNGPDARVHSFSPDGRFLAARSATSEQLEVWDTTTGKSLGKFGRAPFSAQPAYFPDGKTLLVIGAFGRTSCCVDVWDVEKRKRINSLDEDVNQKPFCAAAVSPDGKTVALAILAPVEGQTHLMFHFWDAMTGEELRVARGSVQPLDPSTSWQESPIDGLCFAPDGRSLAVVVGRAVTLVETATGKERCVLGWLTERREVNFRQELYYILSKRELVRTSLAWSPDGRTLAAGCADGAVRLWDIASGREYAPLAGHAGPVRCLTFGRDGKTLRSLGGDNKVLTCSLDKLKLDWFPRRDKLDESELANWWEALAGDDVLARNVAVVALAQSPGSALPFLKQQLVKVPRADHDRLEQLLTDLTREDFNARKAIVIELAKHSEATLAVGKKMNEEHPGRLDPVTERVLKRLADNSSDGPSRNLLALEALARMDTDDARRFLKDLSEGEPAAALTQEAKVMLARRAPDRPSQLDDSAGLIKQLASDDSHQAFAVLRALVSRPKASVPLLCAEIKKAVARDAFGDPTQIPRLIRQLDDEDFGVREQASKELARWGTVAVPALRKTLADGASAEMKVRLEALLRDPSQWSISPDQLQAERTLEALERIGGDDVRRALIDLGRQTRNPILNAAIADIVRRLGN
jgi:hypothetical protein